MCAHLPPHRHGHHGHHPSRTARHRRGWPVVARRRQCRRRRRRRVPAPAAAAAATVLHLRHQLPPPRVPRHLGCEDGLPRRMLGDLPPHARGILQLAQSLPRLGQLLRPLLATPWPARRPRRRFGRLHRPFSRPCLRLRLLLLRLHLLHLGELRESLLGLPHLLSQPRRLRLRLRRAAPPPPPLARARARARLAPRPPRAPRPTPQRHRLALGHRQRGLKLGAILCRPLAPHAPLLLQLRRAPQRLLLARHLVRVRVRVRVRPPPRPPLRGSAARLVLTPSYCYHSLPRACAISASCRCKARRPSAPASSACCASARACCSCSLAACTAAACLPRCPCSVPLSCSRRS